VFIDNDFPKILGAELYRPHPAYIAEMAVEPVVVHDFTRQPGQTVQLDRYKFWGTPGTKDSRERIADQTIGTANSRNITKEKVLVVLKEYTGPADPGDPTQPSTFKIARETCWMTIVGGVTASLLTNLLKQKPTVKLLLPKVVTTSLVVKLKTLPVVFLTPPLSTPLMFNSSKFVPTC
jgi:hypothetical protein